MKCFPGSETYESQLKYGKEVFQELQELQEHGFVFGGIHHDIKIISCCDWKAGACIEGAISVQLFCKNQIQSILQSVILNDNQSFCRIKFGKCQIFL